MNEAIHKAGSAGQKTFNYGRTCTMFQQSTAAAIDIYTKL